MDLWSNLLTGTFALGGAFLGFLGSWFAATRAAKATREQIQASREQTQHDRIHERRDEAVSESYAQILSLDYEYRQIVLQSRSSDKESKHKEIDQLVHTMVEDWTQHFRKNWPWIPDEVANAMVRITSAYQKRALDLRQSLNGASEAKLPEILADAYDGLEATKEEVGFDQLLIDVRAALGISTPQIDYTLALLGRSHDPGVGAGRRGEKEKDAADNA